MRSAVPLLALAALFAACSAAGRDAVGEAGDPPGLPRFVRWSAAVAQGGQPEPEAGFAALAALGFDTVVSVDGAAPAVAEAEAAGLRYVHVPIGYDGVPEDAALRIVKAVETARGPVYVHCHHGMHRGPAAAVIARIALGEIGNEEALADLAASGCSPDYAGLYRDVGAYAPPAPEALAALGPEDLPSAVRPSGMRESMVFLDHRRDFLDAAQRAGWAPPAPDIDPAHEAGMVENVLRDLLQREEREGGDAAFVELARAAHAAAVGLETALREGGDADAAYERLENGCQACHAARRN